jgi:hypothetical protein
MELMNRKQVLMKIEFLENEIQEIDLKINDKCVKPDICKENGIRFFPGVLFGKPTLIPLPKEQYKVPDFCAEYCYYRFCFLEEQQNDLRKQLVVLKSFQNNLK